MAYVNASMAHNVLSMLEGRLVNHRAQLGASPDSYSWATSAGWVISAASHSADIVALSASLPSGGTIDRMSATSAGGRTVYSIAGLHVPLASLAAAGADTPTADTYWRTILAGDSVVRAPQATGFIGYGDAYQPDVPYGDTFRSGDDVFVGGRSLAVGQEFAGDVWTAPIGAELVGGDDTIWAYGPGAFYGDATFGGGLVFGGDDRITLSGAVDDAASDIETVLVGDVFDADYGTVEGGADMIVMRGTVATKAIAGDVMNALWTYQAAVVHGGSDRISVVDAHVGAVYGDAGTVDHQSSGGADIIHLRGSAVAEVSGDFGSVGSYFRENAHGIAFGKADTIIIERALTAFTVAGDALTAGGLYGGRDVIDAGASGQAGSLYGDVAAGWGTIEGGDDIIRGGSEADLIVGDIGQIAGPAAFRAGNDTLYGGGGDDRIYGDAQNFGASTSYTGTGGDDRIDGGDGNDRLLGQLGDDRLIGGMGDDTIFGGAGRNTALFKTIEQAVTVDLDAGTADGQGHDHLQDIQDVVGSNLGDVIAGSSVDNELTGLTGDDLLSGRAGADRLFGGDGNDTLDGGEGIDLLAGGLGDDTYINPTGDRIVERVDGGIDTVVSDVGFSLVHHENVERLILTGADKARGTGNTLDNFIAGNAGRNELRGLDGADILVGGDGNDTLDGGEGSDVLFGGTGHDVFRFAPEGAGNDKIMDFDAGADRLDLGGGHVLSVESTGGSTVLHHDGGTIEVIGVTGLTLADWNALVLPDPASASMLAPVQGDYLGG